MRTDINAILTFQLVINELKQRHKLANELKLTSICDLGCSDAQLLLSMLLDNGFNDWVFWVCGDKQS